MVKAPCPPIEWPEIARLSVTGKFASQKCSAPKAAKSTKYDRKVEQNACRIYAQKIDNERLQNVKDASSHEEHHDVSVADCLTNEGPIDL